MYNTQLWLHFSMPCNLSHSSDPPEILVMGVRYVNDVARDKYTNFMTSMPYQPPYSQCHWTICNVLFIYSHSPPFKHTLRHSRVIKCSLYCACFQYVSCTVVCSIGLGGACLKNVPSLWTSLLITTKTTLVLRYKRNYCIVLWHCIVALWPHPAMCPSASGMWRNLWVQVKSLYYDCWCVDCGNVVVQWRPEFLGTDIPSFLENASTLFVTDFEQQISDEWHMHNVTIRQ